jgi:hypothetical protein
MLLDPLVRAAIGSRLFCFGTVLKALPELPHRFSYSERMGNASRRPYARGSVDTAHGPVLLADPSRCFMQLGGVG